jgi:hypothetical protein
LAGGEWRTGLRAGDPEASDPEVGEHARQVVDRAEKQVLDGPRRGLDRGRAEGRLAARREDDAMDAGCFGAAQEGAHVLGVLERVEDEDERRLTALDRPGEDLVERGETPRPDDECDSLVPVESRDRGQGPALDLDDRDSKARRMEDEPFEGLASLGDDEKADGLATGDERFLDGTAAGDELLAGVEQAGGRWNGWPPVFLGPWSALHAGAASPRGRRRRPPIRPGIERRAFTRERSSDLRLDPLALEWVPRAVDRTGRSVEWPDGALLRAGRPIRLT